MDITDPNNINTLKEIEKALRHRGSKLRLVSRKEDVSTEKAAALRGKASGMDFAANWILSLLEGGNAWKNDIPQPPQKKDKEVEADAAPTVAEEPTSEDSGA